MSIPQKFRKRPVEIEAIHLTRENVDDVARWCGGHVIREEKPSDPADVYVALDIPTLEGRMRAETFHRSTYRNGAYQGGDYVIRGVQGEFYPCKPDIFAATYEQVNPDPPEGYRYVQKASDKEPRLVKDGER